jgi:hypothetical protein
MQLQVCQEVALECDRFQMEVDMVNFIINGLFLRGWPLSLWFPPANLEKDYKSFRLRKVGVDVSPMATDLGTLTTVVLPRKASDPWSHGSAIASSAAEGKGMTLLLS